MKVIYRIFIARQDSLGLYLCCMQILSNEERRNIYDIYGKEGLEAGLEVGEPLRTPNDLKEEFENFKAQKVTTPLLTTPFVLVYFEVLTWECSSCNVSGAP